MAEETLRPVEGFEEFVAGEPLDDHGDALNHKKQANFSATDSSFPLPFSIENQTTAAEFSRSSSCNSSSRFSAFRSPFVPKLMSLKKRRLIIHQEFPSYVLRKGDGHG